jgi:hypothetical protein
MHDHHSTGTVEDYITPFVQETNNGAVFTSDLSTLDLRSTKVRQNLTEEETNERREWGTKREELRRRYYNYPRIITSLEDLLQLRVAPPMLSWDYHLEREAIEFQANRRHPNKVAGWKDFETAVNNFTPEERKQGKNYYSDVLRSSFYDSSPCYGYRDDEQMYIGSTVLVRLQTAGLLEYTSPIGASEETRREGDNPLGRPSLFLKLKGNNGFIPMEFKATHNLLLPLTMEDIVHRYNSSQSFQDMEEDQPAEKGTVKVASVQESDNVDNTIYWNNIVPPLSQILGYMCLAGSRYGVLSSGTRTYFLHANDDDDGTLFISDAWPVGRENYLRAWSWFFHVASNAERWTAPSPRIWASCTTGNTCKDKLNHSGDCNAAVGHGGSKEDDNVIGHGLGGSESDKRQRDGASGNVSSGPNAPTWSESRYPMGLSSTIPWIDSNEIEFSRILYRGANEPDSGRGNQEVHVARWRGQEVVVKSYDMFKGYEVFEKEVHAYEYLKDAWGVLVPQPYFISELYGAVALLGMQLGRDPDFSKDKGVKGEYDRVFSRLLRDHGFRLLERDSEEIIYIPDGQGKERLVAIDLELYEIRQHPNPWVCDT